MSVDPFREDSHDDDHDDDERDRVSGDCDDCV